MYTNTRSKKNKQDEQEDTQSGIRTMICLVSQRLGGTNLSSSLTVLCFGRKGLGEKVVALPCMSKIYTVFP